MGPIQAFPAFKGYGYMSPAGIHNYHYYLFFSYSWPFLHSSSFGPPQFLLDSLMIGVGIWPWMTKEVIQICNLCPLGSSCRPGLSATGKKVGRSAFQWPISRDKCKRVYVCTCVRIGLLTPDGMTPWSGQWEKARSLIFPTRTADNCVAQTGKQPNGVCARKEKKYEKNSDF